MLARGLRTNSGHKNARFRPAFELLEDRTLLDFQLSSFLGLSHAGFAPPDTCGAAGTQSYVETENQQIAIFPKATGIASATSSLNSPLKKSS